MKWDWRQGIIHLALMGIEVCPLYLVLALVDRQMARGQLAVYQLLLAYPATFAFNWLLKYLRWPRWTTYPINVVAWAAVTLLMVKAQLYDGLSLADTHWLLAVPRALANILYGFEPPLVLVLLSALAWWSGWHLARVRPNFATTLAEFQFALAIMLLAFFIASGLGVSIDNVVTLTLVFFAFALLGMSVAHSREGTGWLSSLRGHWPGLLLVSIGLVLVMGLAISALITPDFLNLVVGALGWMFDQVMRLIVFLLSLIPAPGPMEPIPGMSLTGPTPGEEHNPFIIPETVRSALQLGWNIIFGGLLLLVLWRVSSQLFGWLRRHMANMANAEVESMPGAFRADILGFLKRILSRLLGLRLSRKAVKAEPREIASVRQLYRQVLQWAAGHGWRRPAFQTPYEYLPTLEKLLPACADDFRAITRGYVDARYGLSIPSAEELARLKRNWQQIRQYRFTSPAHEPRGPG